MHSLPTKWHSPSPKLSCLLLPTKSKNFLWPFEAGCSETCDNLGVARNSARNATFGRKESFVSSATVVMVVHRHLCSCCCNTQSHNRTIAQLHNRTIAQSSILDLFSKSPWNRSKLEYNFNNSMINKIVLENEYKIQIVSIRVHICENEVLIICTTNSTFTVLIVNWIKKT